MKSDADKNWQIAIGKLRKKKGFCSLTSEEAEAAYEHATPVPLSAVRIGQIVKAATLTTAVGAVGAKKNKEVDWARVFPIKEMRKLRFSIPEGCDEISALLKFFNVPSLEIFQSKWQTAPVAFRQTQVFDAHQEAVAAWVREAEIIAGQIPRSAYNESLLRASLGELRKLTAKRTDEALGQAQEICSRAGVAFVIVPELPHTRISGCARWLDDGRALVALTLRYKTDDQLWFTFFHEIGHILLHRSLKSFVIDNAAEDMADEVVDPEMAQCEEEANRFAADILIPPNAIAEFLKNNEFSNNSIHEFARFLGIGPGIIVSRLQHDNVLKWHQGNKLKQKLEWTFK